jgi:type IV pilus assembly protein PilY1
VKRVALIALCAWLPCASTVHGAASSAAVPPGFIAEPGTHPWSGRLVGLALPSGEHKAAHPLPPPAWEAGALLNARHPESRRLFTALAGPGEMPARLVPLQWEALDTSTRSLLDGAGSDGGPGERGRQLLENLRGARHPSNPPTRKPADSRAWPLGRPAGTPPVLVPPPSWMPGRTGHGEFAARHGDRPALVWLGTRDGLLHAFDARSGEEVLAYLPRSLLGEAVRWASGTARSAPAMQSIVPPVAPCPYPEAADVVLEPGRWRTVLLCGLPASMAGDPNPAGQRTQASVFALDITDSAAPPPALLWETMASETLPLAPAGPVRALALATPEGQRWYAMAMLAAVHGGKTRAGGPHRNPPTLQAGLALLPLDKPARASWHGRHAIARLHLPDNGCGIGGADPALLAVSVVPDTSGTALAAYAVDTTGRLWRFDLRGAAPWHDSDQRVRCIHRAENPAPRLAPAPRAMAGTAVAPVIVSAPGGHLVVYGSGNHIDAVFDSTTLADAGEPRGKTARVAAQPQGSGVVLRRQPREPNVPGQPAMAGWHLPFPNPGERLDRLIPADPGYLGVVTRTPDARQRVYLIHALSGESTISEHAGGPLIHATTGLEAGAHATVVLGREPLPPERPAQPGITSREATALTLWSLEDGRAVPHNRTVASRRTGRLSWRELIRSGSP